MKSFVLFLASLSLAAAFAPLLSNNRFETSLAAEKKPLFNSIIGLDRFNYGGDKYGARSKKNLKVGEITDKSYVPNGLTVAQYNKIRKEEEAKKKAKYEQNVSKAFKFLTLDDFYKKRGTALDFSWKSPTNGHRMAKTKFDWSGGKEGFLADKKAPRAGAAKNILDLGKK